MSPAISPDGTRLGFVAPVDGVLNVWVGPLSDPAAAVPVTSDRGHGVRVFGFGHDDRTLLYLRDSDGDENWRLYALDLGTGQSRLLTPGEGVQAQILGHNRWHPTTVLVGLNATDPTLHDVYRVDLTTGSCELAVANPGFASWLVDSDLQVRGGYVVTPDGGAQILLRDERHDTAPGEQPDAAARGRRGEPSADGTDDAAGYPGYRLWQEVPPEDAATTGPVGFSRDGTAVLMLSSVGVQSSRLLRVDLASGDETVLVEDPEYDVSGVVLDPQTLEVQSAVVAKDRDEWVHLDPALGAEIDALRAGLRGDVSVARTERTDRYWLVTDSPSDGPLTFWVLDRSTGERRFLFAHKPSLERYRLAPMEPFELTARDGLRIHGYLTFPVGLPRPALPAILDVHGGPWVRDVWGYDAEVQWLANRGYLCVQVNYRGSTGYGKAFGNAGDKEWGRAMHHDLLDAVDHLARAGVLDPDRVGIYGGSYGGYAALVGAAFTPDVFACAVDIVGPSNLLTLLGSVPEYWKPMLAFMHTKVGDPSTEADLLWQRSPLSRVDDIRTPLLIAQGANDPRVKLAESEQIVAALTEKGIPHEYLLFPDEGHGLVRPENRERFYAAAERFLGEHLGGRVQPTP
jgi:dipeptidyl aminopeptidase/acylaminoacyl peptidase